jgi:hypothetical protein
LSIYSTVGLVVVGARGKTLEELLALLGVSSADEVARFVSGLASDPSCSGGNLITYAHGIMFHQEKMELTPAYPHTVAQSTSPRSALSSFSVACLV